MRHAFNGKKLFETNEGIYYGINLGYDFCAEHEWGIKKLINTFGIDTSIPGIEGRLQTKDVLSFKAIKFTKDKEMFLGLVVSNEWRMSCFNDSKELKHFILDRIGLPYKSKFASSWSEEEFGIVVALEDRYIIDSIVEAIENKKLVVGIGATTNPFSNGGTIIMFANKIPEEIIKEVLNGDLDELNLQEKAFKKTRIKEILKEAGKKYYALAPKWKDETKNEVIYWLNPQDQQNVNYGWFTLKDLHLWAINKGPIPKTK